MFFKLALKNATRSLRDFTVYFLTLTFGVCLFYVFNSIDAQQVTMNVSNAQREMIAQLTSFMGYFSGFVAVVLGFLIVYANNFLIRRRKKELGVYMTLGMSKGRISRILIVETFFIGLFSLVIGLLIGIFVSQALSVVTAKLFEVDMTSFQFIFSAEACWKSVLYFGVIFVVVMIFNVLEVSRLKLIDLLYAAKKNQKMRIRSLGVSMLLFLASVAVIGWAYTRILRTGLLVLDDQLLYTILLGCLGTLLFFLSLAGFFLRVIKSSKNVYFKGLNMFVLRQLNSKINVNFISMSVICLMIFFTISVLSGGMGVAQTMGEQLKTTNPYDMSFRRWANEDKPNGDMAAQLQADGIDLSDYCKEWEQIDYHSSEAFTNESLFQVSKIEGIEKTSFEFNYDSRVEMIPLSQYNANMRLQGKPELDLSDDQYAVLCTLGSTQPIIQKLLDDNWKITIGMRELTPGVKTYLTDSLYCIAYASDAGSIIVRDDLLTDIPVESSSLNLNYKPGITDDALMNALSERYYMSSQVGGVMWDYVHGDGMNGYPPFQSTSSKEYNYVSNRGTSAMATYLGIYLGLVFLIAGAALLALQQLTEASDNTERYALLRKLGAEERMVNKALFTQIGVYFALPLLLAIVHSIVGIRIINDFILAMGGSNNILASIIPVAAIIVVVYGGYFLATYFASRTMIRVKR